MSSSTASTARFAVRRAIPLASSTCRPSSLRLDVVLVVALRRQRHCGIRRQWYTSSLNVPAGKGREYWAPLLVQPVFVPVMLLEWVCVSAPNELHVQWWLVFGEPTATGRGEIPKVVVGDSEREEKDWSVIRNAPIRASLRLQLGSIRQKCQSEGNNWWGADKATTNRCAKDQCTRLMCTVRIYVDAASGAKI